MLANCFERTAVAGSRTEVDLAQISRIASGQVHLWYVRTEDAIGQDWLTRHASLLSGEEVERHRAYVFQKDRDQFMVARILLRLTLSRYWNLDPNDWRFQKNEFGKPEIDSEQSHLGIRFNLSHCDGLVLCGLTVGSEIGVDCESTSRHVDIEKLAPCVFSADEQGILASVPASKRAEAFFRFWTLKEAYIKARGLGLSLPLQQFTFDCVDSNRIMISFSPEIPDLPETWQFTQQIISESFVAAAAVNLRQEELRSIEFHEAN